MRLDAIKDRIKGGEPLYVTVPLHGGTSCHYSFRDGSEVSPEQFQKVRELLVPLYPPLLPGGHPLSYHWSGNK